MLDQFFLEIIGILDTSATREQETKVKEVLCDILKLSYDPQMASILFAELYEFLGENLKTEGH